jgi:hypothetical protein
MLPMKLYWNTIVIEGDVTKADFLDGKLDGDILIDKTGRGSLTRTVIRDSAAETPEIFTIGFAVDQVAVFDMPDIVAPDQITIRDSFDYSITVAGNPFVIKGESITFNVKTLGVPNNTNLRYNVKSSVGSTKTITAADFTDVATTSHAVMINNNEGTITKILSTNSKLDEKKSFYIELLDINN